MGVEVRVVVKVGFLVKASLVCVLMSVSTVSTVQARQVILHPTHARADDAGSLHVSVRGTVLDYTRHGFLRRFFMLFLKRRLEVVRPSSAWDELNRKTRLFLARGVPGKVVEVTVDSAVIRLTTDRQGQFSSSLVVPAGVALQRPPLYMTATIVGGEGADARRLPVVRPTGVSIISDVDDTIKVTLVPDERHKLANTFIEPYRPVEGMVEAYRRWAQEPRLTFHYVSGFPWPLLDLLEDFLIEAGFPYGSLHLLPFSMRPRWFDWLLGDPIVNHKMSTIESLIAEFPERSFVLIGDSGQNDPEVYAELARRHPLRVRAIRILSMELRPMTSDRAERVFADIDPDLWQVVEDPADLELPAELFEH